MPKIQSEYLIAFSYPGKYAPLIESVVSILENHPSLKDKIFYAPQQQALLARKNGKNELHDVYYNQSLLLVPFFCQEYLDSPWCMQEWHFILKIWTHDSEKNRVLPFCLDGKTPPNPEFDPTSDFFIPITSTTPPKIIADDILERLQELQSQLTPLPAPNLPPKNPNFANRDAELQFLKEKLAQDPLLVLTGQPGLGKTLLSTHHAHTYPFAWKFTADSPLNLSNSLSILADRLGLNTQLPPDQLLPKIFDALPENSLLLYDNALTPNDIRPFLPAQTHKFHILITSFNADWSSLTPNTLPLKHWTPDQSLLFLKTRTGQTPDAAAQKIAHELAHLPLPLEQAAAYIAATQCTYADYLKLYQTHRQKLLASHAPHDHISIAATYNIIFEKLSPKTRSLLNLLSYFAPENIPLSLLDNQNAPPDFPQDEYELNDTIAQCLSYSLITRTDKSLSLHRLLQQILRDTLGAPSSSSGPSPSTPSTPPPPVRRGRTKVGAGILSPKNPNTPQNPFLASALQKLKSPIDNKNPQRDYQHWPLYRQLAPHIISATEHAEQAHFNPSDTSYLLNEIGLFLDAQADYSQAEPLKRKALQITESSLGPNHPTVAIRLNNLAQLLQATNRLAEAEPLMRRSLQIIESSLGPNHPEVAKHLNNIAVLLQDTNRFADAEPFMRRALQIDESSFGPNHPDVARDLNNLASFLQDTNRLADAEPLYRRSLQIIESSLGPNHPDVARNLNNLAILLHDTNRLAEAEPLMRRALQIDESSYGPNHPEVARDLNNLAQLLKATNRLADADPLYCRALQITESSLGPNHPNIASVLTNFASLLLDTNRLAEAEPLYRRALKIDEASFGPNHPNVAIRLNNLAGLLQVTNRLAEAEPLFKRALQIKESALDSNHPTIAISLNDLALLLQATNRIEEAEPLMRRAIEILVHFQTQNNYQHPRFQKYFDNYRLLLHSLNLPNSQITEKLKPFPPPNPPIENLKSQI